MINKIFIYSLLSLSLISCSLFTPNPGENEADVLIQEKQYNKALAIVEPLAQQGIPWAQLRLGIAYEYGQGKVKNPAESLNLYRKVALQMRDNAWADGLQVLSAGDKGYFNQNNDAKVAQYLIARLYYQGGSGVNRNLPEAWQWINYVQKASEGKDVIFCCENSKLKTQYVTSERISTLLSTIEKELSVDQLKEVKEKQKTWNPY